MLEEQRDYQGAIHNAEHLIRLDPLHEEMYRRLIRLHSLNGDRARALWVYHTCTTILKRELDVEPSADTREAYVQLLAQRPTIPNGTSDNNLFYLGWAKQRVTKMLQTWRAVAAAGNHISCC